MALSTTFNPIGPVVRSGQGSALGNREDLSDALQLLAPEDTPLLSLCSKGKASSTYAEWNIDRLSLPNTIGVAEGADATQFQDKFADRARLGNFTTKWRRTWSVSVEQNTVTTSAPANAAASESKAMRELKRDIEATLLSDNEMTTENGAGVVSGLRGIGRWLQSTPQATNPVPTPYLTPAGSIMLAAPTEPTFNDLIASVFSKNGEMNSLTAICGLTVRKRITEFMRSDNNAGEQVYNIMQNADEKKVTLSCKLFDSDFGIVTMINGNPECMPSPSRGYLINPKFLAFNTLIPMSSVRLQNQGGGERGYIECIGTLLMKHPQSAAKIAY